MKLSEVFEQAQVVDDEKARRVVNVSSRPAAITAEEIEHGVTLERLVDVGVPIFRYATQVTIHGRLPDFDENAKPGGYCAIVRNANGSVGVRYVAIDAEKKQQIVRASHYAKSGWSARLSSSGLEVSRFFESKDDCIAAFRTFPRQHYYGGIVAGACSLGGFYVIASIGAVPANSLWSFIGALWGFSSEAELDKLEAEEQARREAAAAVHAREREIAQAAAAEAKAQLAAQLPNRRLTAVPKAPATFVRVSTGLSGARAMLWVLKKRGPRTCYASQPYNGQKSFEPQGKMRAVDSSVQRLLEEACRNGFLMAP